MDSGGVIVSSHMFRLQVGGGTSMSVAPLKGLYRATEKCMLRSSNFLPGWGNRHDNRCVCVCEREREREREEVSLCRWSIRALSGIDRSIDR